MIINWNKVEFHSSYGRYQQIPEPSRAEVAFSGRSNVGKSSLINKLLNRKSLARVSSKPGKTITINFFAIGWSKNDSTPSARGFFAADLPGYGYAKTPKSEKERFGELTEQYLKAGRVTLVVQLIDFRHSPTADDLTMLEFLTESGIPFIIALTKADKLRKKQRDERRALLKTEILCDSLNIIEFSAETGEGVLELRKLIEKLILPEKPVHVSEEQY
jgi:GTP-binding protein